LAWLKGFPVLPLKVGAEGFLPKKLPFIFLNLFLGKRIFKDLIIIKAK